MLGNFCYCNPTRLHFGETALENLSGELSKYGKTVLLTYGAGSVKKFGLYDQITDILSACGKSVLEVPGIMPNPTVEKLYAGCKLARENDVDLILAVGGGSVCDYAKAVSVSAWCGEDPWEKYYLRMEDVDNRIIPVGCVPTMMGTGSEMNGGTVITNSGQKLKINHVFGDNVFPKFSVLNPELTYTLQTHQMTSGIYAAFLHIAEQYFSGSDDNTSDYLAEGLMRSLVHSSLIAVKHPENYEARSNIMWAAAWAQSTLVSKGKAADRTVQKVGLSIGAYTNAAYGMTLSAVSIAYYHYLMPYGPEKFKRFAMNVWGVVPGNRTDQEIAYEGLIKMETWMRRLGLVMSISELGVTEDMLEDIAAGSVIQSGGYKTLNRQEIVDILEESL